MKTKLMLLAAAGVLSGACVDQGKLDKMDKRLETIEANQKQILAKVEEASKRPAAPARRPQPGRPDPSKVYAVPADGNQIGPDDALVTIIEVSEFQCPFCKRVSPTVKKIRDKYGDDVRVVFKHNPLSFHNRAMPAALASECAGKQGKFWPYHDKLFENQRQLGDADLEKYAGEVGLDTGAWKQCLSDPKTKQAVQTQQRQVVALGARGTPAFWINGRFLSGAQPLPNFEKLVDETLASAKKAVAGGIAKKDYYSKEIVAKGSKKL